MPTTRTYIPCVSLKPFIQSFVISEMDQQSVYKVLPGTGIVIGFQYKGNLVRIEDNKDISLAISGVSGLSDHNKVFRNSPNIGTVLVIFREAGAAPFFREPLHELFRQSISLDNFMLRSELLLLEESLAEAVTDGQKIRLVERFLLKRVNNFEPDTMVMAALALIGKSCGNIRIRELARQLNTSQSPLEKRFRKAVGTSPKKFASIVRMKSVLQNHNPQKPFTETAYDTGFYDQAHFIKEFRTFTGENPENFFRHPK